MKSVLRFVGFLPFLLTLTLVIIPAPATAQVSNGSISGNVLDVQGASVPDATVKAVNKDTNQEISVRSDSAGLFKLRLFAPWGFRVGISKPGFRKAGFDHLEVGVGGDRG